MRKLFERARRNKLATGLAATIVVAVVAAATLSSGQVIDPGPLSLLVYSPKYECIEYFDDPAYVDFVAVETEVNVHNPNPFGVQVMTKLLELDLVPTDPSTPGGPIVASGIFLPPDWGFNVDCGDITGAEFACVGFAPPTQEGFVILESLFQLDVVVLYDKDSGQGKDNLTGEPIAGGVDFEYERVAPTITPGPFSPPGCPWP